MDETSAPTPTPTPTPTPASSEKTQSSKMIMILGIVIGLLILAGAGYFLMGRNKTKPSSTATTMKDNVSPTQASMIGSIQDALSKSMSLSCDYTDENGRMTKAYIKSGSVRADISGGQTPQENGSMLMKDNKMYFWSGKQGMMMAFDMSDMMEQGKEAMQNSPSAQNGSNLMENLEKFKQHCKPAAVDDKLFVVPTDVTFQDMSKMMPSGVMTKPSGTTSSPSGMSEEQVKEMMKQYQQSPGQ